MNGIKANIGSKIILAFIGSLGFWILAILVFFVYSFMPAYKFMHQLIFTLAFPLIYIISFNIVIKRIFKEKGWKFWFVNTGVLILTAAVSLGAIDIAAKLLDVLGLFVY